MKKYLKKKNLQFKIVIMNFVNLALRAILIIRSQMVMFKG